MPETALLEMPDTITAAGGIELVDWTPEELAAWQIPELVPTSVWIERHMRISSKNAAVPGPVDLDLTPYLRGIFDAYDDPGIEIITGLFGTQLGKTLALYGMKLSSTCQRPRPQLLVMPTEADAREVAGGVLKQFVLDCEPAAKLLPNGEDSLTKEGYEFSTCNWYFGWSNAPATMARRACGEVDYDEVEKYPPYSGREADPIRVGDARLRTYRNTLGAKSIRFSSPTVRDGPIGKSYMASDQRSFWTPCPACGEYQPLAWSQVHWPKGADGHSVEADAIRDGNLAWYECRACAAHWTDAQRISAVRRGVWAKAGQRVSKAGLVEGEAQRPHSNHAGFHVSSLYSPFVTMSQLAAQWLECQGDAAALQGFINQELGEFYAEVETEIKPEALTKHKAPAAGQPGGYIMGQCPPGVQVVTCGVDKQRGYFVLEARGWGFGLESWLLDARYVQTEQELHEYLRDKRFARVDDAGQPLDETTHPPLAIRRTLIDSGDETADVYTLVFAWGDIDIRPTKGSDIISGPLKVRASPISKNPRTKRSFGRSILLYTFENLYWKDAQARLAAVETHGPGYYHLPADTPDEWFRQFTCEEKVTDRRRRAGGRSGRPKRYWKPKSEHAANHYWDAAVLNMVCTDEQILNLRKLALRPAPLAQGKPEDRDGGGSGWIKTGGKEWI